MEAPVTEIPDAYQEYLRERHQKAEVDKIATLVLPDSDMAALWSVLAEAVDSAPQPLSAPAKAKWESILRSLARSIQEAV